MVPTDTPSLADLTAAVLEREQRRVALDAAELEVARQREAFAVADQALLALYARLSSVSPRVAPRAPSDSPRRVFLQVLRERGEADVTTLAQAVYGEVTEASRSRVRSIAHALRTKELLEDAGAGVYRHKPGADTDDQQ